MNTVVSFLKNGQFADLLKHVVEANRYAIVLVWDNFTLRNWSGIVTVGTAATIVLMLVGMYFMKPKDSSSAKRTVVSVFVAVTLLIYEATILLYSAAQLHRMLLASMVGGAVLCSLLFGNIECSVHGLVTVALVASMITVYGRRVYALPQMNEDIALSYNESLCRELADVLLYEDSGDGWEMTVAALPQRKNLQLWFCLPPYIATSGCQEDYLYGAIDAGTVKSRYLLVLEENEELRIKCQESYSLIWSGCGYQIYKR